MVSINKTTLNFIVKHGEKFVESSLLRKPSITSIEGLRYIPKQVSADVVEISQKALSQAKVELEPATLQALAKKGLSLNEMAQELGIKVGTLRFHLQKFNITTDAQKEFRVLQKYFLATTKEGKANAFSEIDKYLEQIAREEFKTGSVGTFEDCLQDVRLRFFELAEESQKRGISFPRNILKEIKESRPVPKKEISTVSMKTLEKQKTVPAITDSQIESFETDDFSKYFWEYIHKHMYYREVAILKQYLIEGKSVDEIAECFGLTTQRLKNILMKDALPNARHNLEYLFTTKYLL